MDLDEAAAVLGVAPGDDWPTVQRAYRARMRRAHPDVAGAASTAEAARANAAYARLADTHRAGAARPPGGTGGTGGTATGAPPGPPPPPPPPPSPVAEAHADRDRSPVPAEVLDGDTIHLDCPAEEALARLVDAAHTLGEVTYLDRSCGIFEAMVPVAGEGPCSLVVSLQGRADGTDAFCTLEAVQRVAQPPVVHVTTALVEALRRG